MPIAMPTPVVNRLIGGLPRRERSRVLQVCEPVNLTFGDILCEPEDPLRHVWFPLSGFISLVAPATGHAPLEMGLIGSEGMLGSTIVLDVDMVPQRAVVQGTGTALRMTAAHLRLELDRSPALQRILKRYLYVLMAQLTQTGVCTRFHEIEPRLSRWLLMTHDRAHADHFHLTHEFLADMLGVQRSAITIAAGNLQRRGLIGYSRGEIRILDRKGLEAAACECYERVIDDYARLFAPDGEDRYVGHRTEPAGAPAYAERLDPLTA